MRPTSLVLSALALLLLDAGPVQAARPDIRTVGDRIIAEVEVPTSLDETREFVLNPGRVIGLYGEGASIAVVGEGDCDVLRYTIPSFVGDVVYTVDFCSTPTGSRATLTDPPGDITHYLAIWSVEAAASGQGSVIRHELEVTPRMKLPRKVVIGASKRSVRKVFDRLADELDQ